MAHDRPFEVTAFHSCDRAVGLKVLNGEEHLIPSDNPWDWLGRGVYFWEQNPGRALEYAVECANGKQVFAGKIETPFVIGAIIELGNCLNLIEPESLQILKEAFKGLKETHEILGIPLPENKGANRVLDADVFKYLHESRKGIKHLMYDTIRCAFTEGTKIYPEANFHSRLHIEICVLNTERIRGYYLPQPVEIYNPYLNKPFVKSVPTEK